MDKVLDLGLPQTKNDIYRSTADYCYRVLDEEKIESIHIHPTTDLPIPYGLEDNSQADLIFLDPSIGEGKRLMTDKSTSSAQLFAMARQFLGPTCRHFGIIAEEMLRRGIGTNDIDSTTGMTLLHYALRATTISGKHAINVVKRLLCNGADGNQRTLYTDMNALHIVAYFDIPQAATLLLKTSEIWPTVAIDSLCGGFHYGTSLHIAAKCLSCSTAEILLQNCACINVKDDFGRLPEDCIPTHLTTLEQKTKANHIRDLLKRYNKANSTLASVNDNGMLNLGCRVQILSEKQDNLAGFLRYLGKMSTSAVEWAGVELDSPKGNNNGSIGGKSYFRCKDKHGMFIPTSQLCLESDTDKQDKQKDRTLKKDKFRFDDISDFEIGEQVIVAGAKPGRIRYIGSTQFAAGTWCGVELNEGGRGRNDGSIGGVRYFTCHSSRGIFAPLSKLTRETSAEGDIDTDDAKHVLRANHFTAQRPTKENIQRSSVLEVKTSGAASYNYFDKHRCTSIQRNSDFPGKEGTFLQINMKVDVRGANQTAVVRFFGLADFAPGLWIGLELELPSGRNDGSVKGRRYFKCPPNHGVMLRPSRVSYKGIGGDLLIPPHLSYLT